MYEYRHHSGDHDTLPAALAIGIASVSAAGWSAGFIYVGQRLLKGSRQGSALSWTRELRRHWQARMFYLNTQQLLEERLCLAETQREDDAHKTYQSTDPWAVLTGRYIGRSVVKIPVEKKRADQTMHPVLVTSGMISIT